MATKTFAPGQPHTGTGSEESAATWIAHPGTDYYVSDINGTIQRGHVAALFGAGAAGGPFDWDQAKAYAAHSSGSGVLHGTAGPVSGVNDFLTRLTEKSTWIRVGEVVLGLILIAVGLARITHAVPVATKIAKTVGAAGVMA
jgi:hypothetical protein